MQNKDFHPKVRLEVFNYLESLRQSGEHNMFGVRPYLVAVFDLDKHKAGKLLSMYMEGTLVENVVKR
mgnify:FL=1